MLTSDPMYDFILNGVSEGFNIIDIEKARAQPNSETENYDSATCEKNFKKVEDQIMWEMANGRYIAVDEKPKIVSAIGAIEKTSDKVRIIHDASRPEGSALNDLWSKEPFKYQSVRDAAALLQKGHYMCKLDLTSAYRSVRIHASNFPYTGLKWNFSHDSSRTRASHGASERPQYLIDTCLPFGARRSPYIFHQLGQAVRRMMARRGFEGVVVFLDDFYLKEATKERCLEGLRVLMKLLRRLGFAINYNKVVMPTTKLTFLGVVIDSLNMTLELPQDKIIDLTADLKSLRSRRRVTKCQLQSLTGKLNFACAVIYGGHFFVRRLYDAIAKLRSPWHRTRITRDICDDIDWWLVFLEQFNGQMPIVDPRPLIPLYTDSSGFAAGATFGNSFIHIPWETLPECRNLHINFKETIAMALALEHWGPLLRDHVVALHCDNQAAVGILRKCSSRNSVVMGWLRRIFWASATYNFRLDVRYIPGRENIWADMASRLNEEGILEKNNVTIDGLFAL